MKAIKELRSKLESIGATLDAGDFSLHCDAPKGYVWASSGQVGLSIHYASGRQSWLIQAIKEEMPSLKMGLRLADEKERSEAEWNNEEPWDAPEGSDETIDWPNGR